MPSSLPLPFLLIFLCPPAPAQSPAPPPYPIAAAAASGDWQRTHALARAALKTNPRDPTTWTYLGLAADHFAQQQEALSDFAEAVRLAPNATYTHNNYGAALEATGERDQARQQYRRSLALEPNQPPALVNLARLLTLDASPAQIEKTLGAPFIAFFAMSGFTHSTSSPLL